MNTLVVYDSQFGNTEKIARRIAEALDEFGSARVERVGDVNLQDLANIDLLLVGAPTQAWNMTPAIKTFISGLEHSRTAHLCVAPFDTRLDKPGWLTGSAARSIAKHLHHLDVTLLMPPESFLVQGTEGPLAPGELDRAAEWARELHQEFQAQMEPNAVPV